ncbi:Deoxyribodipyrimidine photo-lyase [Rubripirellula lacrimiformis]|uniref:Deoxyribodipyrimidine photo-lyase n=1 Tax=Rubripirellula lacrimiformis TaxID=1930273 RepID=A0A517N640_9BACT|nr:FAD-dependent oxidoreductase [Rubripirellula lacrimiformis]QDT02605.1 Deoxyribodipyrimidine photo-lyase [Rubripirellula lacrimiformis]
MDHSLPTHLDERLRWLVRPDQTRHGPGEFVLYWMHNALRGHDNPALDVAICLARQNGLPLLVYHALSEDYPYASDRFHSFMLQGHRDVQRELTDRGIQSNFHLQRDGARGPHLRDLTRRAAVLVTEEMPVQPLVGWMQRLTVRTTTPIAMVDASCIVPVPLVGHAYANANEYRDATEHFYHQRVGVPYADQPLDVDLFDGSMPFPAFDLQDACLTSLIRKCRVDHSVAPVIDTPGGSRAGYARWDEFKANGLADYSKRRSNAADHRGSSRISSYLHFGMVSPFRIAREADRAGAQDYLDELLVWREMAFHYCFHHPDAIDSLDGIPVWAKETLLQHVDDDRQKSCSWETLSRANTGQPLWDTCQQSLLKHGELHHSARMTWGKLLLPWVPTPGRALQLAIDLNHRYALDGGDPSSYGGILWCFGQFDQPVEPESKVFGRVRAADPDHAEANLNLAQFQQIVDRPITPLAPRIAIVGAGMAGLTAGRTLHDYGLDVTVFEKSDKVGGRIATVKAVADADAKSDRDGKTSIEGLHPALSFDHGAQYFTARDSRFCRYVQSWIQDGFVQPWLGRMVELGLGGKVIAEKMDTGRYVGVPGMDQVAKHLAADLNVRLETNVVDLLRRGDSQWALVDAAGETHGEFDYVIVNATPVQSSALMSGHSAMATQIAACDMKPTWALMIQTDGLKSLDFDAAFINDGPLSWIARDSAKPGRMNFGQPDGGDTSGTEAWVLHASNLWSMAHIDDHPEMVTDELLAALQQVTGLAPGNVVHALACCWRDAVPVDPIDRECLWDAAARLGACGDWCGGPRIEGAFLSGVSIAGEVLRHLTIDRRAT